jgi:cytochrome P450
VKVVPPGWTIPGHVAPDSGLVQPFDILGGPEVLTFPPAAYDGALRGRRVFFSPLYGGFWVFTQYEDIVAALRDSDSYGQHLASLPPMPFVHRQIPVSLEPPEHGEWRRVLLGVFTPRQARDLEPTIAAIARETAQQLRGRNECEIFSDFGMVLPSTLFAIRIGLDPKSEQFTALQRLGHEIVY